MKKHRPRELKRKSRTRMSRRNKQFKAVEDMIRFYRKAKRDGNIKDAMQIAFAISREGIILDAEHERIVAAVRLKLRNAGMHSILKKAKFFRRSEAEQMQKEFRGG